MPFCPVDKPVSRPMPKSLMVVWAALLTMLPAGSSVLHAAPRSDGRLELEIVDAKSGLPIAARVHLKSTRKRAIQLRLPDTAEHGDHFYIDGKLALPLGVGQYTMEIEAGSEYRTVTSQPFEIGRHADDTKRVKMPRFANLNEEGWWAGDLDVMRPLADLPLAMKAEGINVVPARTPSAGVDAATRRKFRKSNADAAAMAPSANQFVYGPRAVLDERIGGGLLLFDVEPPLDLSRATPYSPTSLTVIRDTRQAGGHVVARTPYAWDLPVWLASSELDAIQLIHHHSLRNNVDNREDDGQPRDRGLFPGPSGNGRWSEAIYYHVLNCGLRIPPAAGSGTGANDSPLGNNRVYVYCGEDFSYDKWWAGLDAGRVFVTNGPLLRPLVQGRPPGDVFSLAAGETLAFEIGLDLATRVPVEYLQIIQNGRVAAEVRLADWKGKPGKLPPVVFDASGWFLVRAVTNNHRNYQFASSGPYYVEQAGKPRVSGRSVQFFLDWITAAQERITKFSDISAADRAALLAEQELARQFFENLLATANAE